MRVAIGLVVLLATGVSVMAGTISVTSPDYAHTFAYGEMVSHQFYPFKAEGELVVQVTFSNQPYADSNDPPTRESFDFRFPGVQFDSAQRIYFAKGRQGELIPVAQFAKGFIFGRFDLAPGAKIYLVKDSGRVTATLTATDYPRAGARWVQADDNFSLQNILSELFGELVPDN